MIRRNRDVHVKVEAKKTRTKKAITVAAVLVTSFAVGNTTAQATDPDSTTDEVVSPDVQRKIDSRYVLSKKSQRRAHRYRHKRGASHKYHRKIGKKTQSLKTETRRANLWRQRARMERKAYNALRRQQRRELARCTRAGFPRKLCPAVIDGAKLEGKKSWAFDSNLAWIVKHESGFRPCVINGGKIDCGYKGVRAYGLFQFLGSTWDVVGCTITPDPTRQTSCGIRYISRRYHTPTGAVKYWRSNGWY